MIVLLESPIQTPDTLPQRYYLGHFRTLAQEVLRLYGQWLTFEETQFIRRMYALPEPALCLYLRLINRKSDYFLASTVQYEDIADLHEAAANLIKWGFLALATDQELDTAGVLAVWPTAFLQSLAGMFVVESLHKCRSRHRLCDTLGNHPHRQAMLRHGLTCWEPVWRVNYKPVWHWLLFLYFGQLETNLSRFAVHDLRMRASQQAEALSPRFSCRPDAEQAYCWHQIDARFHAVKDTATPLELEQALNQAIDRYPISDSLTAAQVCEEITLKIALRLQKAQQTEAALNLYARITQSGEATIARLKLLWKLNRRDEALTLANQRMDAPNDTKEALYVKRFLARANKIPTDRDIPTVKRFLANDGQSVEQRVLTYWQTQGWEGVHTENWVWQTLFGLTFWHELHAAGVFHNSLQQFSSDFRDVTQFWRTRRDSLEQRLALLATTHDWRVHLQQVVSQFAGQVDAFVHWSPTALAVIEVWLNRLPLDSLKQILRLMAQDIRHLKHGLPDLFVWNDADWAFYEVKSVNDRLSHLQTFWIRQFQQLNLHVWVFKLSLLQ